MGRNDFLSRALLQIIEAHGPIHWSDTRPHLLRLGIHSSPASVRESLRNMQRDYKIVLDGKVARMPVVGVDLLRLPAAKPIDIFS